MTDEISNEKIAIETKDGQTLNVHKIYVKDLSFESPNAPMMFLEEWEPQATVDMHSQLAVLPNGHYDVALQITLTVKNKDKTAYLCEVSQAGVFELTGYSEDEVKHILGSFAPATLFPFAREVISDLTVKGGFAPYILGPVNFDKLFHEHSQQAQAAAH